MDIRCGPPGHQAGEEWGEPLKKGGGSYPPKTPRIYESPVLMKIVALPGLRNIFAGRLSGRGALLNRDGMKRNDILRLSSAGGKWNAFALIQTCPWLIGDHHSSSVESLSAVQTDSTQKALAGH